jgi:hypothetical protein
MRAMETRRVTVLLVILLVAVTLGCGKKPGGTEVSVLGTQGWTDSGLDVVANQIVLVKASGQVFANPTVSVGPDGTSSHPEWKQHCVIPDAPHAGLIGKIGQNGAPFMVGSERSIQAAAAGRLYLGINDKHTANNKGAFKAVITLK